MSTEIIERNAQIKAWRRIVPLMSVVLFFCALDRVNIGFAALQMNAALGLSNTEFGTSVGVFAIGYALFGIPSTLLLQRMGARRWISLIMIAWGLCSAATAFVKSPGELMGARLLLGAAEAGFYPGMMLYLSCWFPSEYRGRVLGSFFMIQPLVMIIGGPISSALLSCDGLIGFAGWQWLLIIEALPTILLAPLVFCTLRDRPADALWLSPEEKEWLVRRLGSEQRHLEGLQGGSSVWRTFANRRVWVLATVYLAAGTSGIGTVFFLPLLVRSTGFSISDTGFVVAVPGIAAALMLPLWGVWTDRSRSREAVAAASCCAIAVGLLGAATLLPSPWAIVPMSVAMIGFFGFMPAFWTLPSAFLTGPSAATGIGLITVIGNLGTLSGPYLLGYTSDLTGAYGVGLVCLAMIAAAAAAILAMQAICSRNSINQRLTAEEPSAV